MSLSASLSDSVTTQGVSNGGAFTLTADMGIEPVNTTLEAGIAVSDWVKTDANTAAGNLAADHGLTSGTYDVYWTGGKRYGVTVTITSNAAVFEGGAGDDFPASANTTVIISKQVVIPSEFAGNDLVLINAKSTQRTILTFRNSSGTVLLAVELLASVPRTWYDGIGFGATNPLAGNSVASITASNGSTTDATLTIVGLQDAIT
ncbi:hypothetical protein [Trichococcus shcherbakoviae]|uniref:hypothetical protein n=1 Tax=Trichococcus shcherbakoviae TaxID=2094020 RepID=UPI002AA94683|nr:hypothetical protein [Trichococcus shcherbakoviae]